MWDGREMLYKLADQWVFWEDGNTLTPIQDNLILMQYTGMKDKNGKEIFESDILNVEYNYIGYRKIVFRKGNFNCHRFGLSQCNIVGNIHENPEILEAK